MGNSCVHFSLRLTAEYSTRNFNLVLMYVPSYTSTNLSVITIDQAFSVGTWTQIKVENGKPYIAYYNSTETGSRDSIKLAYCNSVVSEGNVPAGIDPSTDYTTGNWEYMTVPAILARILSSASGSRSKIRARKSDIRTESFGNLIGVRLLSECECEKSKEFQRFS